MKEALAEKSPIAIIGFGRFGQVLTRLLSKNFTLYVHDKVENVPAEITSEHLRQVKFVSLEKALECSTLFLAVPISAFSELVENISGKLKAGTTVIDVCSVKVQPVKIMQEFLPKNIDIIATHPLFGPDSFTENPDLRMMMHPVRDKNHHYKFWKQYFENQHIHIIEMTPEAHDEAAAFSQGLTHYIGRILEAMDVKPTQIDTQGFKKLLSIKEHTCNDTWQLYSDLQDYNPYSPNMQEKFKAAVSSLDTAPH